MFKTCLIRMELLSDEGFRFDGRKPNEFRKISGRLGVFDHADGSAILQQVILFKLEKNKKLNFV